MAKKMIKLSQNKFEETVKRFCNDEPFLDEIWYRCAKLLNDGYQEEAYLLILSTWNFARFRYYLKQTKPQNFYSMICRVLDCKTG